MKRLFVIFLFATSVLFFCNVVSADETSFTFGSFGRVFLYEGQGTPRGMVIFISGDGGWNKGVVDMARTLSRFGVAVAGVDITHYLYNLEQSHGRCMCPVEDFEALIKYVQKRLDLPRYTPHPRRLLIWRSAGLCRARPGPAEYL